MRDDSKLQGWLENLIQWLAEIAAIPPYEGYLLLEGQASLDGRGMKTVSRAALKSPEEYETRFEQLFQVGHFWIRMGVTGIILNKLVIQIQPSEGVGASSGQVAVNMAGPAKEVSERPGWTLPWKLLDDFSQ